MDYMPTQTLLEGVVSADIRWQSHEVTRDARAALFGNRPRVLWFTGISGAGDGPANLPARR
jgi:bifunctional enzyme CysN/CysC